MLKRAVAQMQVQIDFKRGQNPLYRWSKAKKRKENEFLQITTGTEMLAQECEFIAMILLKVCWILNHKLEIYSVLTSSAHQLNILKLAPSFYIL